MTNSRRDMLTYKVVGELLYDYYNEDKSKGTLNPVTLARRLAKDAVSIADTLLEELDGYREKAQPDTASGSEEVCDECKECLGLNLICPGNSYHPGRCPSFVPQPTEEELDPIKEQLKHGEAECLRIERCPQCGGEGEG